MIRSIRSAPKVHAGNVQQAILAHIKDLQDKLGPEEELQVSCHLGPEVIRVHQVGLPNWHVLILTGTDANKNATSFIMDMHTVQLVCKVVKVVPPQKPVRIGFIVPEPEQKQPDKQK
jgi:hypothetical protein